MESSSIVSSMPFKQNPRHGQTRVFNEAVNRQYLNIKLPTGYGKTFTAAGCYSIKKKMGEVTRLLFIVPTDAQLEQFVNDGPEDLRHAAVDGPREVVDIRFFGTHALKKHRNNSHQVYAITVQSLITKSGLDTVGELLVNGKWMIVVDEYHHYGIDKKWGRTVMALSSQFLLAMSATPNRKKNDSAFGDPHIAVTYREAVDEGAVKYLKGHSYTYRIDAVMENGEITSFTTNDLVSEAGTDTPAGIEAYKITRKMRWSAKYVSPLVTIPIERMLSNRISSGYRLQAIVGAMCVSHAEMVCGQIKSLFPEITVDWVGTGEDGRPPDINKRIISKFCPKKDKETGKRNPTLDILVHVGMAGEGMDSVYVSEVVHLNSASKNNSNDQENGRASRILQGVIGNINFDSTSDYAKKGYIGSAIMDAMDDNEADPDEDNDGEDGDSQELDDVPELPEEPSIQIWNMELDHIDSGDLGVKRMAKVAMDVGVTGIDYSSLDDLDSPEWDKIINMYKSMRAKEADQIGEKERIMQWQDSVKQALRVVTGRVIRLAKSDGRNQRDEKSYAGDVKKRINGEKKRACGSITEDEDVCKSHYKWLKELESELISKGVPSWLL